LTRTYYRLWLTSDRPDLSSERALHIDRTATFIENKINIWSLASDGARHQDRQTDWQSVVKWLWLWLWQSSVIGLGSISFVSLVGSEGSQGLRSDQWSSGLILGSPVGVVLWTELVWVKGFSNGDSRMVSVLVALKWVSDRVRPSAEYRTCLVAKS
jgi:hypothetical protein